MMMMKKLNDKILHQMIANTPQHQSVLNVRISLTLDRMEFLVLHPFLYPINTLKFRSTNIKKFYFYIQPDTCLYDT
jgi:hypothetical protein